MIEDFKCGIYQHYKNKKYYEVIGCAIHSETHEPMIVYKALYNDKEYANNQLWVRPKTMFFELVMYHDQLVPRFKYVS